jgi:anti-sigma factor ChrR (cupin superfamily)
MSFEGVIALVGFAAAVAGSGLTVGEVVLRRRASKRSEELIAASNERLRDREPSSPALAQKEGLAALVLLNEVGTAEYATEKSLRAEVDQALARAITGLERWQDSGNSESTKAG